MAFNKCNYCDGETVITAENLNAIQDAICEHEDHVQNKSNPHGVTAAQVGAAPAGYGLGALTSGKYISDWADAKETGLYNVSTGISPTRVGGWVWVESYDNQYKSYTFSDDRYGANCMQTTMVNGVIQPWDWNNPPMQPGVEYRTTERWNGKVVYAQLVNFGALPNNTGRTVEGCLPFNITPISISGIAQNGKGGIAIPSMHIHASVDGEWGSVYIATDENYSAYTGVLVVKYVKD